jgi:hypothetical protein
MHQFEILCMLQGYYIFLSNFLLCLAWPWNCLNRACLLLLSCCWYLRMHGFLDSVLLTFSFRLFFSLLARLQTVEMQLSKSLAKSQWIELHLRAFQSQGPSMFWVDFFFALQLLLFARH